MGTIKQFVNLYRYAPNEAHAGIEKARLAFRTKGPEAATEAIAAARTERFSSPAAERLLASTGEMLAPAGRGDAHTAGMITSRLRHASDLEWSAMRSQRWRTGGITVATAAASIGGLKHFGALD